MQETGGKAQKIEHGRSGRAGVNCLVSRLAHALLQCTSLSGEHLRQMIARSMSLAPLVVGKRVAWDPCVPALRHCAWASTRLTAGMPTRCITLSTMDTYLSCVAVLGSCIGTIEAY
jgi:hypothetical protein